MKNKPTDDNNLFEPGNPLGAIADLDQQYEEDVLPQRDVLATPETRREYPLIGLLVVIGLVILGGKLVFLQVAQNARNRVLAEGNRIRARTIPAPRGAIVDRHLTSLVRNVSSFVLEVYPTDLPSDLTERRQVIDEVHQFFPLPQDVKTKLTGERLTERLPITLSTDVGRDQALLLETKLNEWPGVVLTKNPRREYEAIAGLGAVIGYTGKITQAEFGRLGNEYPLNATLGKAGLEKTYESDLRGVDGQEQVEVDSRSTIQRRLGTIEPQLGKTLKLHLDLPTQRAAAEGLEEALKNTGSVAAAAVALDPRNGGVRAIVSLPSFDPNSFSTGLTSEEFQQLLDDPHLPLLNRATSGEYESGSTIKPFLFTAGLQEGVITPQTAFDTPSEIRIGEWVFPDWKDHGLTDVRRAIAESNNIFAFTVGGGWDRYKGLGPERIGQWLEKFGFGAPTQIDLPFEQDGFVPTPGWKRKTKGERWFIGDTYNLSIGQGDFLTTPLQIAAATAAIANGGTLYAPRLADRTLDPRTNREEAVAPKVIREALAEQQYLTVIREGMRMTVTEGSGRSLGDLPFEVAGKTGTAQFGREGKTHAWFIGFAPYENPEIVVAVLVEGGGEGHAAAAPVAKKMLQAWWQSEHQASN